MDGFVCRWSSGWAVLWPPKPRKTSPHNQALAHTTRQTQLQSATRCTERAFRFEISSPICETASDSASYSRRGRYRPPQLPASGLNRLVGAFELLGCRNLTKSFGSQRKPLQDGSIHATKGLLPERLSRQGRGMLGACACAAPSIEAACTQTQPHKHAHLD